MSKEVWKNIELWRPRSCYLYIARKCLECPNYRPWNDFDWGDYLQRERIMKTFCVRHLPVLRGEVLIPTKYLKDPESWDDVKPDSDKNGRTSDVKTPPKKKRPVPSHCKHVQRKQMWDFEKEAWVPNEMGTQSPGVSDTTPVFRKSVSKKLRKKKRKRVPCSPSSQESDSSLESFKGAPLRRSPRKKQK